MDDLYSFVERYIEEAFEEEAVLKTSSRGCVRKLRHKGSHRRYISRFCHTPVEAYLMLKGVACPHLPRIYEAAGRAMNGSNQEKHLLSESGKACASRTLSCGRPRCIM